MDSLFENKKSEDTMKDEMQIFTDEEKEKAEIILNQLEGMRIISAKKLLHKCKKTIMQSYVGKTHWVK